MIAGLLLALGCALAGSVLVPLNQRAAPSRHQPFVRAIPARRD